MRSRDHDHVKREPGGHSPDERKLQNNFRTGAVEAAEREWYRPARRPTEWLRPARAHQGSGPRSRVPVTEILLGAVPTRARRRPPRKWPPTRPAALPVQPRTRRTA